MGPTSPAPLPARGSAGKAPREMACGQASFNAPAGRDRRERLEDEAPLAKLRVGDRKALRAKAAAAPQHEVQVENTRPPAPPSAPAECSFDPFERFEHIWRIKIAFDERYGIGKIASGSAVRRIEDDRRCVEQPELLIKTRNSGFDDASWTSKAAVRPVRSDCDGVEVRCMRHDGSPRSARCA